MLATLLAALIVAAVVLVWLYQLSPDHTVHGDGWTARTSGGARVPRTDKVAHALAGACGVLTVCTLGWQARSGVVYVLVVALLWEWAEHAPSPIRRDARRIGLRAAARQSWRDVLATLAGALLAAAVVLVA